MIKAVPRTQVRNKLYWIVLGGFAFWLPAIVLSAILRDQVSILMLNMAPLLGLIAFALVVWIRDKKAPKWGWVLAGVYIFGPAAILTAALLSGGHPPDSPVAYLIFILLCLFPPMTLYLSLMNVTFFSVLAATVAALFLILVAQIRTGAG
jgi:hypothetical protein